MKEFRNKLLELLGKEVYIKCDFQYLLWDSEKPTLFLAQDYRNVIDLYNSYSHSITIIEPTGVNDKTTIRIERY